MKRLIIALVVLGLTAGCNRQNISVAKQAAHRRWQKTRAELVYGLAKGQFDLGDLAKAKAKVNEVLRLDPGNAPGRELLARIYIEQGTYRPAISLLGQLRQEHPKSADIAYLLGVAQEKQGLLSDALASYRQSQALDRGNVSPVIAAAEVLVAQGDLRQAQNYVDSYITLAGDNPGMYELAGRLAMMRKEYGKAAGYYQQAVDLDCNNQLYAESLGRALFMDHKYRQACEVFVAITKAAKYEAPCWVYTMLGDCYMATNRAPQAREAYFRATELSPSDAGVWCNLAKAALAVKDTSRAIVASRQALRLDSNRLDASLVLGYALLRDGQGPRAVAVLSDAVGKHPRSAELLCLLGRAYAAGGDNASAGEYYAKALRIDPDNQLAVCLQAAGQPGPAGAKQNIN